MERERGSRTLGSDNKEGEDDGTEHVRSEEEGGSREGAGPRGERTSRRTKGTTNTSPPLGLEILFRRSRHSMQLPHSVQ